MDGKKSKATSGKGRTRVFATVVYPDSSGPLDEWKERLVQEHVAALISPFHDKDVNPDGTQKKPHYHLLILFDGVKSESQVSEMLDRVLGEDRVKVFENVNSTRGYARYLCHLDNPEKAQYSPDDVIGVGGAVYEEYIHLPTDDYAVLDEIFEFLDEAQLYFYASFMDYCRRERRDWWKLLVMRHSYVVIQYMKSKKVEMEMNRRECIERGIDPNTGEMIGATGIKLTDYIEREKEAARQKGIQEERERIRKEQEQHENKD